ILPALLTRTEIDWLLGKKSVSKNYEYKMKSNIKNRLRILNELELPLLMKKGIIGSDNPTLPLGVRTLPLIVRSTNQNDYNSTRRVNETKCPSSSAWQSEGFVNLQSS